MNVNVNVDGRVEPSTAFENQNKPDQGIARERVWTSTSTSTTMVYGGRSKCRKTPEKESVRVHKVGMPSVLDRIDGRKKMQVLYSGEHVQSALFMQCAKAAPDPCPYLAAS
jgi:hypothetical protein